MLSPPVSAAVVVNRTNSVYSDTSPYRDYMRYKMNCYGYATHLYYPGGSSIYNAYKQQPGEFADNTEPYGNLYQSYYYARTLWNNLYYFVVDRMYEDFGTLDDVSPEFGTLTETTRTASVPDGQRKIALSIRQEGGASDYHFYLRHSDGTWSHKRGVLPITDYSISGVKITDANIETASREGGYDDGTRYFLITKSVVVDFPHNFGQDNSTLRTTTDFRDKAGDRIEKSFTITNSWNCRFDYPDEKDFFKFTPTSSGTYNIYTDRGAGYNVDGAVFDSNGNMLVYDTSPNNMDFDIYLTAGSTYYIGLTDIAQHTGYYVLWVYK